MLEKIEVGIRPLVKEFIEAGRPCSSDQSIEARRTGYLASTSLAGPSPKMFAEYDIQFNSIKMKVYQPVDGTDLPICIYYHGGCFISGSYLTHEQQLRTLAKNSNCIFVCIEYRLAPEYSYPAAHDDAYQGALAVKEHAQNIAGNAQKISFMGDSAGGHLALATALRLKESADWLPHKLALIYPMLDIEGTSASYQRNGYDYIITNKMLLSGFELYLAGQNVSLNPELNVLKQADFTGLMPIHIITAEFDPLLDEGLMLFDKLKASGVKVSHNTYSGVIHGFVQLSGVSQSAVTCIKALSKWISY